MALKISLTLLVAAASVAATPAKISRDMATAFFNYCDQSSLEWYSSDQQAITADCSTTGDPVYYESRLDLNYCFGNHNETMGFQVDGGAFGSCACEMGDQIESCRPNCQSTQLECACKDHNGSSVVNNLNLNDYIGLGFDDDGHLVMECYSSVTETVAKGTFLECTQYGYTTDCE